MSKPHISSKHLAEADVTDRFFWYSKQVLPAPTGTGGEQWEMWHEPTPRPWKILEDLGAAPSIALPWKPRACYRAVNGGRIPVFGQICVGPCQPWHVRATHGWALRRFDRWRLRLGKKWLGWGFNQRTSILEVTKSAKGRFLAQDCQIVCVDLVKKRSLFYFSSTISWIKQIGLTQRTRDKSPTHHCRDKQFQAFSLTASLSIFIKSQLENPQDKMINPYINQCHNYFQSFPIIAIVLLANLPIPRPFSFRHRKTGEVCRTVPQQPSRGGSCWELVAMQQNWCPKGVMMMVCIWQNFGDLWFEWFRDEQWGISWNIHLWKGLDSIDQMLSI